MVEVPAPVSSVRVLEVGSGDPIIFVHGSPNNAATWVPLAAQLSDRRCLLLDRPGAGLSPPVQSWGDHRAESASIVKAVVDHFSLDTIDLVGSSFGGLYAYNFAMQHPSRVTHLILMGSPGGPSVLGIPAIFRLLSLPTPMFLMKKALRPSPGKARGMFAQIGHAPAIEAGAIPDVVFEWYSALLINTETLRHLVHEVRAIATPF